MDLTGGVVSDSTSGPVLPMAADEAQVSAAEEEKIDENVDVENTSNSVADEISGKRKFSHVTKGVSLLSVGNQVGSGTFGDVFKAHYKDGGSLVAMKKIKMEKETQGFPITAIREIKILNVLKHPNIVELKEVLSFVGEEEDADDLQARCRFVPGDVFMVFEYVDYDLAGLMASGDVNLTPAHIQSYMKQLLTGVHFMHKNNILHRDLKGANILITRDNCLKIADWGLARSFINRKQRFSDKVVTLWYRSPELLLESRQYSSEVDMWSVGCMFGELLLRKIGLFPGSSEVQQLELIYMLCGTPVGETEEALKKLDGWSKMQFEKTYPNTMQRKFASVDDTALDLLQRILNMNPEKRFTAEESMDHLYFWKNETIDHLSLPRFRIQGGGHEYEAKIRHEEAKQKHREQLRSNSALSSTGGGRWSNTGRGVRLNPGRVLAGAGRGEGAGVGSNKKYKIMKIGGKQVDDSTEGTGALASSSFSQDPSDNGAPAGPSSSIP